MNTFGITNLGMNGIRLQVWKDKFVSQFLRKGRTWHSDVQLNLDIILSTMRCSLQTLFSHDVCKNCQPSLQQLVRQQVTSTIHYAIIQVFHFLIAPRIFRSLQMHVYFIYSERATSPLNTLRDCLLEGVFVVPNTTCRNTNMKHERVEIWESKRITVAQMEEDRRHVQVVQESGSWGGITDRQAKSLWMCTSDR